MLQIDLLFSEKYVGRHIFSLKFFFKFLNTYNLINLKYIVMYFKLIKLTDLLDLCLSNYFYFFKYFFGLHAFITKIYNVFNLGIMYYTFFIQLMIPKFNLGYSIFFLMNDIFSFINRDAYQVNYFLQFIMIIITDLSFFLDKKNTIGFFNLKGELYLKFQFSGLCTSRLNRIYLSFLKI